MPANSLERNLRDRCLQHGMEVQYCASPSGRLCNKIPGAAERLPAPRDATAPGSATAALPPLVAIQPLRLVGLELPRTWHTVRVPDATSRSALAASIGGPREDQLLQTVTSTIPAALEGWRVLGGGSAVARVQSLPIPGDLRFESFGMEGNRRAHVRSCLQRWLAMGVLSLPISAIQVQLGEVKKAEFLGGSALSLSALVSCWTAEGVNASADYRIACDDALLRFDQFASRISSATVALQRTPCSVAIGFSSAGVEWTGQPKVVGARDAFQ